MDLVTKLKFSQEEYEQIEDLSAVNYSPERIAKYLSVDKKAFLELWYDKTSLVRYHYDRGELVAQFEINQKQLENAKKGNITSAQIHFKIAEENRVENIKKQVFYGAED
ncbi:hypothetical protein JJL45_05200 [Tamlana sp. s12]|uniref:hypothetical protein n=1 Tax=Tamlana sp. s12 TaxID=1630406 RepID=UPI0007FF5A9C|nr:hypothetical protein [Tamlana sp. s12]OBQ56099.1 hypothetical protein VQ01_06860 [Tamlana sp. s12]QQY83388.1 hypothetical protein JJL45_05200 [Tamlana sp. s12]